jgi:hypothetical protein
MKDLPFSAYDLFGYLAAGFVVLAGVDYAARTQFLLTKEVPVLLGVLLVLLAYAIGHAIAQVASLLFERLLVYRMLGSITPLLLGVGPIRFLHRLFPGYVRPLPLGTRNRVLEKAKSKGLDPTPDESLFYHCLAVVRRDQAVLGRLNTFLALYGFARNVSMALFLTAPLLLLSPIPSPTARLLVVGVFLLAVILLYRYLKFFRHYAVEVYTTYAETE